MCACKGYTVEGGGLSNSVLSLSLGGGSTERERESRLKVRPRIALHSDTSLLVIVK